MEQKQEQSTEMDTHLREERFERLVQTGQFKDGEREPEPLAEDVSDEA